MTSGSKLRLFALGAAALAAACAPRKTELGGTRDAASFFVGSDGGELDGAADASADAPSDASTDLGPPCLVGGTNALSPVTLGCAQAPLGRVVVADDHVYWTVQGAGPIVQRAPLSGGPAEVLVSDFAGAFGLLVDDQFVYYTQPAISRVMRIPRDGRAAPVALAETYPLPLLLASDGASLYWTGTPATGMGVVMKLDLSDGAEAVTLIDGQAQPRAIAVRDGFVYWTDVMDGSLRRTPDHVDDPTDAGIRSATRLASGLESPGDLLLSGDYAYLPDRAGRVVRVPLAGGDLELVAAVDGQPYGLATDGAALYWTVLGAEGGVFTGPLTPSSSRGALVVGGQLDPHFLAVAGGEVYWATWGPRPAVHRFAVRAAVR